MYRVSVCGAGRAATELTLPAFDLLKSHNSKRMSIVSVADIDGDKASMLAKRFGVQNVFTDVSEMLRKDKPNIMVINTPVKSHYSLAMEAIDEGVNFIIEKPATETVKELREIREAARKAGVKGMVVHNYRFLPGWRRALEWYKKGKLGSILHVDRIWMSPAQLDRMEKDKGGWWHQIPGGRLADSLPHHLYVAYPFVGEMTVEHVSVRKLSDREWSKCDEANIMLKAERAYVNVRLSTNQEELPPPGKRKTNPYDALVYGTKRAVAVFHNTAHFFHPLKNKDKVRFGIEGLKDGIKGKVWRFLGRNRTIPAVRGGHAILFGEFLRYVQGEIENPVPWDEAIHVMELSDEIGLMMERQLSGK